MTDLIRWLLIYILLFLGKGLNIVANVIEGEYLESIEEIQKTKKVKFLRKFFKWIFFKYKLSKGFDGHTERIYNWWVH